MFSFRSVRERVLVRMKILRGSSEDDFHEAYAAAMSEEMREARASALKIVALIEKRTAHHPSQGWIMVDRRDQEEAKALLNSFLNQSR